MQNSPIKKVIVRKSHHYASEKRHFGTAVLLAILAIAGVVGYRYFLATRPAPVFYQGEDEQIMGMMRDKGAHEINEWLKEPANSVRSLSNIAALDHARTLKTLGAVQVMAIGYRVTACLVVELPEDAAARARLFAFAKDWQQNQLRPVPFDCKQRYIQLDMPADDPVGSLR